MIRLGRFLFRYRNALFPLLIAAGVLLARPRYPFSDPGADALLDGIGALIGLAGQGLRILTIGYEYIRRGGRDGRVYADELVTGGIFALSRNPLYVGNIALFAGVAVMINDPWLYAIGIPAVLVFYRAIVAAEEHFLGERFGEAYAVYCRRVNRWWPDLRGLRRATAGMRFNWPRVLVKEYNTTFAWLTAMLAVQIWQLQVHGIEPGHPGVAVYAALFVPLIAAYLGVRLCKKRRLIRA